MYLAKRSWKIQLYAYMHYVVTKVDGLYNLSEYIILEDIAVCEDLYQEDTDTTQVGVENILTYSTPSQPQVKMSKYSPYFITSLHYDLSEYMIPADVDVTEERILKDTAASKDMCLEDTG